uniref:DUF4005 domain-containing protein n=1 Tax=Kalanchoe fedtschenkoi TaxID=63787 RepID=A0A7N0V2I2_KALFE
MGKSPAKWIKSVLTGKKAPRQKVAKGKEKAAHDGEVLVAAKATERDLAAATIASHLSDDDRSLEKLELEHTVDETSPQNGKIHVSEHEAALLSDALDGPERREQDQAAIKVQASFRGYLARRAYLALKGIIRLQALIRGHLVRRQAASTIHCMLGIVKLQAHVRGQRVRLSDIGLQVQGKVILETIWGSKPVNTRERNCVRDKNMSTNAFGLKFFALSPGPLNIQYDPIDPNSVTSWLDRWSASHFWKPAPVSRKPNGSIPLDQNQGPQDVKTETSRATRNRKVPSGRVDNSSMRSSFEVERSRRTFRKPMSRSVDVSEPEAALSELEKVKRSLRKVHESTIPTAIEEDKPKQSVENTSAVSVQDVSEQTKIIAPAKITEDPYETMPTLVDVETSPEQPMFGASDSLPNNETNVHIKPMDAVGEYKNIHIEDEGSNVKQDALNNENQKPSVKGSSPAKHESAQNGSNKQPKVPSYMAATKSAKAKMRDQDLLVFEQEALEKTPTSTRRQSLPSATGTKVSSSSRIQKLTQSNEKGKNKSAKPVSAPKDATGKADWRR